VWRRCLPRHLSHTCLKNVVVSVPAFQPRGDLGGSGWKPVQTNFQAITGFASWNTRWHSECSSLFQCSSRGVRSGGERRRWALGAATCGFEPHGRWESIGAAAERWGGPGGPAPAAGTVGCSSVPFRSRLFQCARIGFGGKEATLDPASSTNRRAIGFCVDCGTDHQSPAGRAAGRWEGRGSAHSLVST
jgi:hypothetical protein